MVEVTADASVTWFVEATEADVVGVMCGAFQPAEDGTEKDGCVVLPLAHGGAVWVNLNNVSYLEVRNVGVDSQA